MSELEQLRSENAILRHEVKELRGQVEKLTRAQHVQAGPFRRPEDKRKKDKKRPGRKKGHKGHWRKPPEAVDEEVETPLERCPDCGSEVGEKTPVIQYIEEIPVLRPHVTRVVTYRAQCPCGCTVQSRHPLQRSLATGAAGTHLGPRALAIAIALNKGHGLTIGRTCKILEALFGLKLSRGGLAQALQSAASKTAAEYERLLEKTRKAPVVHVDETSWWVGGPKHWLWVFATGNATAYRVEKRRNRDVVTETLGEEFPGILVSDCLNIYDDATPLQHKCYSHHLKAISDARKIADEKEKPYLEEVRALLKAAMAFKKVQDGLPAEEAAVMRRSLEETADRLLGRRQRAVGEKVRCRLLKQRDHLFTFLDHDEVDATNNLAERQLRPAVIARKLSCGNRTDKGARTFEVLASLAATCGQRNESFLDYIASVFRLTPVT